MSLRLAALGLGLGLALGVVACSGPVDSLAGDDLGDDSALQSTRPLALHYAWLQENGHPMASSALIAKGMENVVVTSRPLDPTALPAWSAAAADWKAHGGVLARHATPNEIVSASEGSGLAAFVSAAIADGFAYVAIDELEPAKAARLHDGDPAAARVRDELHAMNNVPSLRQRVIVYANAYNMVDDLEGFSTILRGCRDYCRVFVNEVYLGANEAFVSGAVGENPKTGRRDCANGIACIGYFANKVEAIAPGLGKRTITALGTSAAYLPGTSWESSYCWGPRGGALRAEVAKVRTLGQPGVATYTEAAVANDVTGADFTVARDKYAGCLRGLLQEGGFSSVGQARAPDGFTLPSQLPTLPLPAAPTTCGRIDPGQGLGPGQEATSCDGRFRLVMQSDGNLVLFMATVPLWSTQTSGKNGYAAVMQGDGNFVLYGPSSAPLWSSTTAGASGAWVAIQDDGNLVVYGPNALWNSGTFGK